MTDINELVIGSVGEDSLDQRLLVCEPQDRSEILRTMIRQAATLNLGVGAALRVVLWMIWKYSVWAIPVEGKTYTKSDWIDTFLKPYLNDKYGFEASYLGTQLNITDRVVAYVHNNQLQNPIIDENGEIITPERVVTAPTRSLATIAPLFTDNEKGGKGSRADHKWTPERDKVIREIMTKRTNEFIRDFRERSNDQPRQPIVIEYRVVPNSDGTVDIEMPRITENEMALLMARLGDLIKEIE